MSEVLNAIVETDQSRPTNLAASVTRMPEELADIVVGFASSKQWMERVRLRTDRRWYERLYLGEDYDIWVISWLPGQSTGFHDHGESCGAFVVATGILEEHRPGQQAEVIQTGKPRAFGCDYAHDVRNASLGPAISIHSYSPPLSEMNQYEFDGDQLVPRERASEMADTLEGESDLPRREAGEVPSTIDQVLAAARRRLVRLSPLEAFAAASDPQVVLVDIRPESQRASEGSIPNALVVERNVLEWRFDPASSSRLAEATGHDLRVIVFCSEGYTSSLAAASLQDLGLWQATDIIGGFQAWKAARLPSFSTTSMT